jgi:hypothetical protein
LRIQPYYKALAQAWQNGGQIFMHNILIQQFQQLTAVLQQYRPYWQVSPFRCRALPWLDAELLNCLNALDEAKIQQIEQQSAMQQQYFANIFPALFTLPEITESVALQRVEALPFWLENGIAGRKLQQIDAFCQHWPDSKLPVLEWCAGKGHLGRILAHRFAVPVTSVEWQRQLCADGAALAQQYKLAQQFICADVLVEPMNAVLCSQQHIVALHACGQLHVTLLQQASNAGCQQIQLVPCCYHLIDTEQYQPMSEVAVDHNLMLDKDDLKLVVQGQVTAGERITKLRKTEVLWRLAYDELRMDISGHCDYRPLSSVAKHWFSSEFADFARWAATEHQLDLPASPDWALYLQRAQMRAKRVRRIELIRHLFRRPLELWLALDKALYLQQHGYDVRLTQLCDYQITPRNVLLQASRRH